MPIPITLPTTCTVPMGPTLLQRMHEGSLLSSQCAGCSARLCGQDLAPEPLLGSNSNPTRPPGLTFRPIHLFMGFMRKEERKPLMYITRGMVAMYFCKR